jgi:hypothetical protein
VCEVEEEERKWGFGGRVVLIARAPYCENYGGGQAGEAAFVLSVRSAMSVGCSI